MPVRLLLLLLFPLCSSAQTFVKERFIAHRKTVVWSEIYEIKDMDTPFMTAALTETLKSKSYVLLDSVQQPGVLTGKFLHLPLATATKGRFRVDFLYESYIVTVGALAEFSDAGEVPLESVLLQQDGTFIPSFPKRIEQLDTTLAAAFVIQH